MFRKVRKNSLLIACLVTVFIVTSGLFMSPLMAAERSAQELSNTYIQIAKKVIPSVVHIEVTAREEVANPFLPFENDPFFRYFFNTPDSSRKFKRDVKGIGTGMIIDSSGNILTNYHVAGGATKIEVLLAD